MPWQSRISSLRSPVEQFTSAGGRAFTVGAGEHSERYEGDSLWCDTFPILLDGVVTGELYRSLRYGKGKGGDPRWHAPTTRLVWAGPLPPTGLGFDVAAFDTAGECLAAWGRSADQILDWRAYKPVPNIYARGGVSQRVREG